MLPGGTLLVINGTSTLADFVLVFCLSLSIGIPLLKALSFAGTVACISARSMTESVALWPLVCCLHLLTKESAMFLPISTVGIDVFCDSALSQSV